MNYKKILANVTLVLFPCFSLAYTWDSCLTLTKVMNNADDREWSKLTGLLVFQSVDSGCKIERGEVILYRIFKLHSDFESAKSFVINNYPKLLDEGFISAFKFEYCARDPKDSKWVFRGDPIYYVINRANGDLFARYQFSGASCK